MADIAIHSVYSGLNPDYAVVAGTNTGYTRANLTAQLPSGDYIKLGLWMRTRGRGGRIVDPTTGDIVVLQEDLQTWLDAGYPSH